MNSKRARILIVYEQEEFRSVLRFAEQALLDVAIAFGHSFSLLEGSLTSYPDAASVEAFDAILFAGSQDLALELAEQLSCHTGLAESSMPPGLEDLSHLKQGGLIAPAIIWPMFTQEEQLHKTAISACYFSKERGSSLYLVPPALDEALWLQTLSKAAMYSAHSAPKELAFEACIIAGLSRQTPALCFSSFDDAKRMKKIWDFLYGHEACSFTRYNSDTKGFSAIHPVKETGKPGFFAAMYAAASLLQHGLHLPHEAECLKTVADNVLVSGWRTPDLLTEGEKMISESQALHLVQEQVALAGELFDQST